MLSRCHTLLQSMPITFSLSEGEEKTAGVEEITEVHLAGYTVSSINMAQKVQQLSLSRGFVKRRVLEYR